MNNKKTMLIAHNDDVFAEDLSNQLADEGLDVVIASDGNQAIAVAEISHPDLIVLGIRLPERSGFYRF